MEAKDFNTAYFPTWCPGCGDFGIWAALKQSLVDLAWKPDEFLIIYGIGCSGNMNDFVKSYGFHSLHGRAIANAVGFKLANHQMPLIVVGGDGDLLGEGGNHFIHACRGNYDLTVIIHDNKVYGLTTGQVSPTAAKGNKSKSTPAGIIEIPVNPLALAISQGATYVAQGFAGDIPQLTTLIINGVKHKGLSIINVLQPCVTFNKVNTYDWYRQRVYKLEDSHKRQDKIQALQKALEQDKIPTGVLYEEQRPTYEESVEQIKDSPLVAKKIKTDISPLLEELS